VVIRVVNKGEFIRGYLGEKREAVRLLISVIKQAQFTSGYLRG